MPIAFKIHFLNNISSLKFLFSLLTMEWVYVSRNENINFILHLYHDPCSGHVFSNDQQYFEKYFSFFFERHTSTSDLMINY